jgi:hypothetical protein
MRACPDTLDLVTCALTVLAILSENSELKSQRCLCVCVCVCVCVCMYIYICVCPHG